MLLRVRNEPTIYFPVGFGNVVFNKLEVKYGNNVNNVDIAIDIHPNVLGSKTISYGIYIYRFINSSLSLVCFAFLVLFVFLFAGLIHHILDIYSTYMKKISG